MLFEALVALIITTVAPIHRRYVHELIDIVASGQTGLAANVTQAEPLADVIAAYEAFDRRESGWVKVKIEPSSVR